MTRKSIKGVMIILTLHLALISSTKNARAEELCSSSMLMAVHQQDKSTYFIEDFKELKLEVDRTCVPTETCNYTILIGEQQTSNDASSGSKKQSLEISDICNAFSRSSVTESNVFFERSKDNRSFFELVTSDTFMARGNNGSILLRVKRFHNLNDWPLYGTWTPSVSSSISGDVGEISVTEKSFEIMYE